jgi:hypothetical protein
MNLFDNVLCPQTGKLFNSFNEKIVIDAKFPGATRFFVYKNIKLIFDEGRLDKESSLPPNIDYWLDVDHDVKDFFPEVIVKIQSPFTNEWGEEIVLKKIELDQDLEGKFNDELGIFDSDVIIETIDYKETKDLEFYELWLPSDEGKYRDYMKIDFKNIFSYSDLLDRVIELALENYDFYVSSPDEILEEGGIIEYKYIPLIPKYDVEEIDTEHLVSEIAYLLKEGNHEMVFERLRNANEVSSNKFNLETVDNAIKTNPTFMEREYKSLGDIVNKEFLLFPHLAELGSSILSIYK